MLMTKSLVVGLLIAVGEIVNGNVRVRLLHSRFGKKRAKLISFFSGTLIIYGICWLTLPWLSPSSSLDCLIIGLVWLAIMLALEIYFGSMYSNLIGQRFGTILILQQVICLVLACYYCL